MKRFLALPLFLLVPATAWAESLPFERSVVGTLSGPRGIAAADVDGDGDLDLLVAEETAGRVVALRNNGLGTVWTTAVVNASIPNAKWLTPGDWDDDGDIELAAGSSSSFEFVSYSNEDGLGTSWRVLDTRPNSAGPMATADLDRDGDLDVASATGLSRLYAHWNSGTGSFLDDSVDATPVLSDMAVGDIDRDGEIDAIVCGTAGTFWFPYGGTAVSSYAPEQVVSADASGHTRCALGDVDGDGDLDAIAARNAGIRVVWFANNGAGTFGTAQSIAASLLSASSMAVVDLDRDGDTDVVVTDSSTGTLLWYENGGAGASWTTQTVDSALVGAWEAVSGDFDGDGDLDLATTDLGAGQVSLYLNQRVHGTYSWANSTTMLSGLQFPYGLDLGDVDRDGDLDLLCIEEPSGSNVAADSAFLVHGSASGSTWSSTTTVAGFKTNLRDLSLGDFDRDGDLDSLLLSGGGNVSEWFSNTNGLGTAWGSSNGTGNTGSSSDQQIVDIDNDGDLDVVRNTGYTDGQLFYHRNNGSGTSWTTCTVQTTFNNVGYFTMADVDGDGDQDIVAGAGGGSQINPQIAWIANDGSCGTWVKTVVVEIAQTGGVAAGDIDSDGDIDIVGRTVSGIRYYRNDGSPSVASWPLGATVGTGAAPNDITLVDMDRDGDLDVLGAYSSSVTWWENTAGDGTAWSSRTQTISNRGFSSVADLDRDGILDVAVAATFDYRWYRRTEQQVSMTTTDTAPAEIEEAFGDDVLRIAVAHTFADTSDVALELAHVELFLHDGLGGALSDAEADALFVSLEIWRDQGDSSFDAGADTLVDSVTSFSLVSGVLEFDLPDGDPLTEIATSTTQRFFVVVELEPDASALGTIDEFGIDHVPTAAYAIEHAGTSAAVRYDGTPTGASVVVGIDQLDSDDDGVPDADDCDDLDSTIYPGAAELCDPVDSDCNGSIVDSFTDFDLDLTPDCVDLDDDNDLDPDTSDCADTDAAISANASETCDAVDSDCDGSLVDGASNFDGDLLPDCVDLDDDGDGGLDTSDCDDANIAIYLGAPELCDLIDSDCDLSLIDTFPNDDTDGMPNCVDLDDDDDTDPDTSDCDDDNAAVYSGAAELCDLIDSDCDGGIVDESANFDGDGSPDCVDLDDDGDGDPDASDCADTDASISATATELCDAVDQDCDGSFVDEDPDTDGNGTPDCTDPDDDGDGTADGGDCASLDATIYPGATEFCDAVDQDCDGSLVDAFVDTDGDLDPDCTDLDDDDDTLPDAWETANGLDPLDDADATSDTEGDGRDALDEYAGSTDPAASDLPGAPSVQAPTGGEFVTVNPPELVAGNAVHPLGDLLTYRFEVYDDEALTSLVASGNDVVEDGSGSTAWTVAPTLTEDGNFWWRAAASDAFGQGPWSELGPFVVDVTGQAPSVPVPTSPLTGQTMELGGEPLTWEDSTSPEGLGVRYEVELYDGTATTLLASDTVVGDPGTAGEESFILILLTSGSNYAWRVRAVDPAERASPYCAMQVFGYDRANLPPSAPLFTSPDDGGEVVEQSPDLVASEAIDPEGGLSVHFFALSSTGDFDPPDHEAEVVGDGSGTVVWDLAADGIELPEESMWFARVDALDPEGLGTAPDTISFFVRGANEPPPTPEPLGPTEGLVTSAAPEFLAGSVEDPENDVVRYEFAVWPYGGSRGEAVARAIVDVPAWQAPEELVGGHHWSVRALDSEGAASDWSDAIWFVAVDPSWLSCSFHPRAAAPASLLLVPVLLLRRRRR